MDNTLCNFESGSAQDKGYCDGSESIEIATFIYLQLGLEAELNLIQNWL